MDLNRHLELADNDRLIGSVCGRLFSSASPTFRRGEIGEWRRAFDHELERLFEEVVGSRIATYGYVDGRALGPER